jgi:hypothetical protein
MARPRSSRGTSSSSSAAGSSPSCTRTRGTAWRGCRTFWTGSGAAWTDLAGKKEGRFQLDLIHGNVYWPSEGAYGSPGAPPNGSDYVRFRDAADGWVSVKDVTKIRFQGEAELVPIPLEWTIDATDGDPPPSFYSGEGDNLDRAVAREVTLGAGNLVFDGQ